MMSLSNQLLNYSVCQYKQRRGDSLSLQFVVPVILSATVRRGHGGYNAKQIIVLEKRNVRRKVIRDCCFTHFFFLFPPKLRRIPRVVYMLRRVCLWG